MIGQIDLTRIDHVEISGTVLLLGDAMKLLAQLEGVADMLLTDPPYLLSSGGNATQVMGGLFAHENYDNKGALMDVIPWHDMGGPTLRACKENADAYVMANDKNVFAAHAAFIGAGWKFHNLLTWDKGSPTRNRFYMKETEQILYLWKGRAKTINMPGSTQIFEAPRPKGDEKIHPTQKPVSLYEHYILNSSQPGDIVLDPFAGSASALVAAMRSGRRGLGIEKDPKHFKAAVQRLIAERDRLEAGIEPA